MSLLSSATLAASAVGAIIFGRVADILGRKKIYGYEVLILAIGAIASAFAPSIGWLLAFRIILGIGIGGDYPVSATIMSEYSGKKSRGQMVGLVFSMQAAGLVVGPLLAVILLAAGVSHDLTWRLLLGFGAIPGMAVFYLRRKIQETPRFALAGGADDEAAAAVAEALGTVPAAEAAASKPESKARNRQPVLAGWMNLLRHPGLRRLVIGTAVCWFMLDFAYYGNTIASPEIISLLSPNAGLEHSTLLTLLIFLLAAAPGYAVAILLIDKLGRKHIQVQGFFMMALMFGMIAIIPGVATAAAPFVILFGISYFFTEFGPNTTTFVYPAEVFPVDVRTSGHGIAAALGKMGAFAGTYLFPIMLSSWGIRGAEGVAAATAVIGLIFTLVYLPETKGRTLEELGESALGGVGQVVPVPAR